MKKFLIILGVTIMLSVFAVDLTNARDYSFVIACGNGKTCTVSCSGHNLQEALDEAAEIRDDFCA